MGRRLVSRRLRRFTIAAITLFAVFLVTAQFEHHDIACHLKTPQHCTACAASALGSDPHPLAWAPRLVLADAGGALCMACLLSGTVLPSRLSGRSPPSA